MRRPPLSCLVCRGRRARRPARPRRRRLPMLMPPVPRRAHAMTTASAAYCRTALLASAVPARHLARHGPSPASCCLCMHSRRAPQHHSSGRRGRAQHRFLSYAASVSNRPQLWAGALCMGLGTSPLPCCSSTVGMRHSLSAARSSVMTVMVAVCCHHSCALAYFPSTAVFAQSLRPAIHCDGGWSSTVCSVRHHSAVRRCACLPICPLCPSPAAPLVLSVLPLSPLPNTDTAVQPGTCCVVRDACSTPTPFSQSQTGGCRLWPSATARAVHGARVRARNKVRNHASGV